MSNVIFRNIFSKEMQTRGPFFWKCPRQLINDHFLIQISPNFSKNRHCPSSKITGQQKNPIERRVKSRLFCNYFWRHFDPDFALLTASIQDPEVLQKRAQPFFFWNTEFLQN